jgi:histidinol-phosphate phosphatase family protein
MSIALGGYLDEMLANDLDGLVLCRYSDHPDDSDTLIIGRDSLVKYLIPKEVDVPSGEPGPQLSLSGVLFIRTEVLRDLPGAGDFQAELFQMVRDRKLRVEAKLTRFFLRDTGTPKRLQAVQESVLSGSLDRRGSSQAAGVFIDRDGTLIPNRGDDRTRIHLDEVSPKVVDELLQLNISGIPWFVVSNQPGVAKGKITMEEVDNTFLQLQRILSQKRVFYDDFRYCPHHPERGWEGEIHELKVKCKCRKPSSGMIEDLAEVHSIDIRSSWIIGDSPADEQLAFSAGAGYIGIQTDDSDALAEAIRSAASEILNAG